ncbi:carbohydrate ABC transporter permease [Luxibacter massiliensis]|uniref:carbohydrate ABC transporter permease n=1 Tax=Luxibacter massiliensis TaxID=2219695 RepID=UPI000F050700|nr:carbohydrate ABC transporter permease [Luxibacter massiliensis]
MDHTRKRFKKKNITNALLTVVGILVVVMIFLPILWMVRTSVITLVDLYERPLVLIFEPIFTAYKSVFAGQDFLNRLLNSLIIAVATTLLCGITGALCAYGMSRFKLPGGMFLPFSYLFLRMIPSMAIVIPVFNTFKTLGLLDTRTGLVLVYTTFGLPLVVWTLWGFYKSIPRELEEAAAIDGSNALSTFVRVILPISVPSLASVSILTFTSAWNEFFFAMILTSKNASTAPTAIALIINSLDLSWGEASAAGTLIILPVAIIGVIGQKYFISGLSAGAVKG